MSNQAAIRMNLQECHSIAACACIIIIKVELLNSWSVVDTAIIGIGRRRICGRLKLETALGIHECTDEVAACVSYPKAVIVAIVAPCPIGQAGALVIKS